MIFYLKISSKTKSLMFKFIYLFLQLKFLSCVITNLNNLTNKKFITVLKSPHVNKTAQEQFEFRYYTCQFLVFSPKPLLLLVVLKKLFRFTFLGLKLELKILLESNNNSQKKLFNPDYFVIRNLKKSSLEVDCTRTTSVFLREKSVFKYIQLFDLFGEVNLKHMG